MKDREEIELTNGACLSAETDAEEHLFQSLVNLAGIGPREDHSGSVAGFLSAAIPQ